MEEAAPNQLIDEGIAEAKLKLYSSYTEAANELKVPQLMMTCCTCGWRTHVEAYKHEQILSAEEDTELVQ